MATAEKTVNDAGKQMDAVKADMDAIRSELKSLMDDVSSLRSAATSEAKAQLDERMADISARATKARKDMSAAASEQADTARKVVQDNPIASVAAAFGLGLLAARLLK